MFENRSFYIILLFPFLAGCSTAPSLYVLGAFFPSWLFCIAFGVFCTLISRVFILKCENLDKFRPLPVLYLSLTALYSFLMWIAIFQN